MSQPVTTDVSPQRGEVPCSYHPKVMTGLRCTRCGKPICPRCGVRTPVGLRCPDCAGVRGLPTYQSSTPILAKTAGVGLVTAIPIAVLWGYAPHWGFYLALGLGFGVAEAMAWASNAKRGRDLQLLAFLVVGFGLLLSRVVLAQRLGISLEDINNLDQQIFTPEIIREYGRPVSVTVALYLRLLPDGLFAALSFLIVWVRFR